MRPHRRQLTRLPRPWDSAGKNTGVGCHFLLQRMKVKSESEVTQSCPTLSDPMDCSLPGSSVHGIFQARGLEWGAIAFSENSDLGLVNQSISVLWEGWPIRTVHSSGQSEHSVSTGLSEGWPIRTFHSSGQSEHFAPLTSVRGSMAGRVPSQAH